VRGYLAVDIGASTLRTGFFDPSGRLRRWRRLSLRQGIEREEFRRALLSELRGVLGEDRALGVGVGSVGPLDARRGTLLAPVNLGIGRFPLAEVLEEELGVRVALLNDCKAAALGEYARTWRRRGYRYLVYVGIGTGIGGGVIEGGRLLLGKMGNASEVGHMTIVRGGRPCRCGGRGHWEAYCSGLNMPGYFREWAEGRATYETADEILRAAQEGEPLASSFLRELAELNALALANLCNLFDPEAIVMGGGVFLGAPQLLLGELRRGLVALLTKPPEILKSSLGELSVLYGAFEAIRRRRLQA
jgi:glucokinase